MAVAFDAFGSPAEGTGNLSWTHTPVGVPKGILVFIVQNVGTTDEVTGVTYGGVPMTRVTTNTHSTGEASVVYAYFLGAGIPSGAQTVVVSVNGTGSAKRAGSYSITALGDTKVQNSNVAINSDSLANPSSSIALTGNTCFVAEAFQSGQNNLSGITPSANWTGDLENDFGTQTAGWYSYNIIGSTNVLIGWTQTAEDACCIGVAVTEDIQETPRKIYFSDLDCIEYEIEPIDDELGFTQSPLAGDVDTQVYDRVIPDQTDLADFDPIEDELGFTQAPLSDDIIEGIPPPDLQAEEFLDPIDDELGFIQAPLSDDIEELFGALENPDMDLYDFEPIEDEYGYLQSPLSDDIEELFGSNSSVDMDLYDFEPIEDELGYLQAPLSDDLVEQGAFPDQSIDLEFEPIEDELGFTQAPLSDDVEEIFQGEEEYPVDIELYDFEPIEDELGYLQAPLSDDIEELFGALENPDVDLYGFDPIEDELGFLQSPLSDDIEELMGEWEYPDDFDLYDFEPIKDELGFEQAPLSDDIEELFGALENPDMDLYQFDPIEDELGYLQAPLSDDIEELFGRLEIPDMDLYGFDPIDDELGFIQAPLSEDLVENLPPLDLQAEDLLDPIEDEVGFLQSPLSDDIEELFGSNSSVDMDLYQFEPIEDELGFLQTPRPGDITSINVSDSGTGTDTVHVDRSGPPPKSSGGSGGGDGDGRWWGKHYEERAWEWLKKPPEEEPPKDQDVKASVQQRSLEFLERKIRELKDKMAEIEIERDPSVIDPEKENAYISLEAFVQTLQQTVLVLQAEIQTMRDLREQTSSIAATQTLMQKQLSGQVQPSQPLGQLEVEAISNNAEKYLGAAAIAYLAQDLLKAPLDKISGQLSAVFALKGAMLLFERWLGK